MPRRVECGSLRQEQGCTAAVQRGVLEPARIRRPDRAWQANLSWVTEAMAVGGSFPCERAAHLARTLGIRAIVDLRAESCDDAEALARVGLAFLHLPTPDQRSVAASMLERGVAFATEHLSRGRRVLVHCEHGIGRSAQLALCILVELGYEPLAALALVKARRACVSPSPAQYRGWAEWLARRGRPAPEFEAFARIAYAHLASG